MSNTTNKNIEKPAYNSYIDTWNTPLNSNFDVIDAAFGSTTSLNATGGSATLTAAQYEPLFLSITGAISAPVTYTIPSGVGGQWIVYNGTTDSSGGPHAITIASGGGGTSVALTRTLRTIIISDGTNIRELNYLKSTDFPVSVANGGTGTTTLTANNVLLGNGTSSPQFVAPGTTGNVLTSNGSTWQSTAPTVSAGVPTGSVSAYAGSTAPAGWLLCFGQAVSRSTYADLFAVIATTYGAGDGSTTFNLPDARGRGLFGKDDMGGTAANRITNAGSSITGTTLGASGGAQNVTLSLSQIPSHSHSATSYSVSGAGGTSSGYFDNGGNVPDGSRTNMNNAVGTGSVFPEGGGSSHQNMPPAIILNYIIKI
jgi:microcystin-dependent protein